MKGYTRCLAESSATRQCGHDSIGSCRATLDLVCIVVDLFSFFRVFSCGVSFQTVANGT